MSNKNQLPPEVSKKSVQLNVNGKSVTVNTFPMARLLDVLREDLELKGSKEGCGEGECGACSVLVNGRLVNSCLVPIAQLEGAHITTIEGISQSGALTKIQQAFWECGGAQCGICTPGMVVATHALIQRGGELSDEQIREGLAGNLCRCTGYMKIFDAVRAAVRESHVEAKA